MFFLQEQMKRKNYISKIGICIILLANCISDGFAQNVTNYTFSASSGTFTALVAGTTNSGQGSIDDGAWNNNPIGFDFWYMGTRYTTISASTNGWLAFGSTISSYGYVNSLASTGTSNATILRPVIAPLWDDLAIATVSSFTYQTSGSAGSRVFTAEYLNEDWQYAATSACISFQVKLYEGTGKIEFIYKPESGTLSTPTASIGITGNATGTYLSLNETGISPGASSTSETNNLSTKPASGQTYRFTPPVPADPGGLNFTSITSSSMTLNWTDNSSNEVGFVIYRSNDNGNTYDLVTQTTANVTSSVQSGLLSSTIYYWKVYAVTEGALSINPIIGNETTSVCTSSVITRTWVGAGNGGAGTDFNAAANWSPSGSPTCADSLYMPLTGAATIALSSSIEIGAIKASISGANNVFRLNTGACIFVINQTATYSIPSGNFNTQLQVNVQNGGTIIYNKSATFSAAAGNTFPIDGIGGTTGKVKFKGDVTFGAGCAAGTVDQPNTVVFDAIGTQTITCNNTGYYVFLGKLSTEIGSQNNPTVIISGSSYSTSYGNLNINGTSTLDISTKTLNRYASGGSINMAAGSTLKLAASSGGQTGSNFPSNFTTFAFNVNSTVEYNAADGVNQTLFASPNYGNLTLTNKTGSGSSTKTAGGNLTVAKNLTVSNAFTTFSSGTSRTHSVAGDWINDGSFTYITSSTVTFNGTANQLIGGTSATTFYNLTTNNTGTTGNDNLTLNKAVTIVGALTLTDGIIVTTPAYLLTLNAGATSSSGNNTGPSFIDGPVAKVGSTAFTFPTGNGTKWARIAIGIPSASETFTAQYFNTGYGNYAISLTTPYSLDHISILEYWTLSRSGSENATVQLFSEDASTSQITNCSDLRIVHWCSSCNAGAGGWENNNETVTTTFGACAAPISPITQSGNIVSIAAVSSFSPFTFASKSGSIPLPIELVDFNANCNENNVELKWVTASETNNDYFTIEKSTNSVDFESLGNITGAGNSSSLKNYSFNDMNINTGSVYYRLKQIDFNGSYTHSDIIAINACVATETAIINAYTDSGVLTLNIYSNADQKNEVTIYEITGRKVLNSEHYLAKGNNKIHLHTTEICFGAYLITLQNEKTLIKRKIIMK